MLFVCELVGLHPEEDMLGVSLNSFLSCLEIFVAYLKVLGFRGAVTVLSPFLFDVVLLLERSLLVPLIF